MPEDHCNAHERNTEDITTMKANVRLLMWMTPIVMAIAGAILNYTLSDINDNIKSATRGVTRVEAAVQLSAVTSAGDRARLDSLERLVLDKRR